MTCWRSSNLEGRFSDAGHLALQPFSGEYSGVPPRCLGSGGSAGEILRSMRIQTLAPLATVWVVEAGACRCFRRHRTKSICHPNRRWKKHFRVFPRPTQFALFPGPISSILVPHQTGDSLIKQASAVRAGPIIKTHDPCIQHLSNPMDGYGLWLLRGLSIPVRPQIAKPTTNLPRKDL